jgi:hypothetical protein
MGGLRNLIQCLLLVFGFAACALPLSFTGGPNGGLPNSHDTDETIADEIIPDLNPNPIGGVNNSEGPDPFDPSSSPFGPSGPLAVAGGGDGEGYAGNCRPPPTITAPSAPMPGGGPSQFDTPGLSPNTNATQDLGSIVATDETPLCRDFLWVTGEIKWALAIEPSFNPIAEPSVFVVFTKNNKVSTVFVTRESYDRFTLGLIDMTLLEIPHINPLGNVRSQTVYANTSSITQCSVMVNTWRYTLQASITSAPNTVLNFRAYQRAGKPDVYTDYLVPVRVLHHAAGQNAVIQDSCVQAEQ